MDTTATDGGAVDGSRGPGTEAYHPAIFDLQELSIAYEDIPVLRQVDLRIEPGEKVVLIGPSGAGKTTLLRHLQELGGTDCSVIHQDYALVPQLSAFHNVYAGRLDLNTMWRNLVTLLRPGPSELSAVRPILQALDMEDKLHDRVQSLSGGQQQRVAVGRAIYRDSEILLGDEPVSAIDPHQAGRVLDLIRGSAATVVLAMHDVELALDHFPRVVALRDGQIFFDMPSEHVDAEALRLLYRSESQE
ncbi:MAG: ATP-binding cassette domain-containing protein [Gemmatimonadetes bacterium]|jgi:phosphonate transport system ATP-binding protein|nr:ATP-binding cassette domain-containing protein [Gemmatimonadota bacterium]